MNQTSLLSRLLKTDAPAAVLLIRLLVGAVFLSEGIQKFLYPATLGVGRFIKLGIPIPHVAAPFVGGVEILCGLLVLLGLLTRLAAVPLVLDMCVAIASTKLPLLMKSGFWSMAHEARTDWCMLLGSLFLILIGGGALSVDAGWQRSRSGDRQSPNY